MSRRIRRLLSVLVCVVCVVCAGQQAAWPQSQQSQWNGVERVIAFGDVHGAWDELTGLLREAGVTDGEQHWNAGTAHVVSLGDLLDRGTESRRILELLMRLQEQARAAGGDLHVLLGNHEAMNLLGDLRYVNSREYASYADLESASEREAARAAWRQAPCTGTCPSFDEKFPPGYFGRRAAFAPTGRYGKWLLAQPVAIMINDTLFMHGGPSSVLKGMNLAELNVRYRTALTAALTHPESADSDPLLSDAGPNWYRGDALCNEASETDVLLPLLAQFGAARLVIGHTPTRDARVASRFGGKVIRLDTGMNRAAFRGRPAALLMSATGMQVRYAGQPDLANVEPQDLFVTPDNVPDEAVLATLRDGSVTVTGPRGPDELEVMVTLGDRQVPAVFRAGSSETIRREVAAWRLDRLLQLTVVPATIERKVQGVNGILQARPQKWQTEAEVRKQANRGSGWCSAEPQLQLIYALDTLLGNAARTSDSLVWDTENWYVFATSFGKAFGRETGLPAYLKGHPPVPGAELRRRLASLDDAKLTTALDEFADARTRRAILARRDTLLALPAAQAAAF